MFRSYIATKETSYLHIQEMLSYKRKTLRIFEVRFGMEKDDIANECWKRAWDPGTQSESNVFHRKDCSFHREAYSDILISNCTDNKKTRKTTSVLVENYLEEAKDLLDNRVRLMKENGEEIILQLNLDRGNNMSESEEIKISEKDDILLKLIQKSDLSMIENELFLWKIGVKLKDEVKKNLGVSADATLYNRWDKLSTKLCKVYYSNKEIFDSTK